MPQSVQYTQHMSAQFHTSSFNPWVLLMGIGAGQCSMNSTMISCHVIYDIVSRDLSRDLLLLSRYLFDFVACVCVKVVGIAMEWCMINAYVQILIYYH